MTVSQAHFNHHKNIEINHQVFGTSGRSPSTTESIHRLRALLKTRLHQFIKRYRLDLLVVQNAVSIPMHVPLGLAITETIAETGIPTIAHHHDFAWERSRFARNGVSDFLQTAFPPKLPGIEHVVINSGARDQGVDLRFMTRPARNPWEGAPVDDSDFSLWDIYAHSDFITFPSRCEGFGNAFLEAVYFRKPILVNRYATFLRDIEPLGFDLVMTDGYVDEESVRAVRETLGSPDRRREIGLHNYRIAPRHFS